MTMTDLYGSKMNSLSNQTVSDATVGMSISQSVLEQICKKMIEVVLYCLPQAIRGTIYRVGSIPELRVVRVASGDRQADNDQIIWDVRASSDYDPPGKAWDDYRDRPGDILEAMAWCVERQKSWTSDYPENNIRSMRKQLEGKAGEDYHHMEPVLVRKSDLWKELPLLTDYPMNHLEKPIWQDTPFATVAVIKIHFIPESIRRGDKSTRVIKKLSDSLGTQMLSLHARRVALEQEERLAEERQETCNTLAHEFRNIMTRAGFSYRAINNEISYLREFWETLICQYNPEVLNKQKIITQLNQVLASLGKKSDSKEIPRLMRQLDQLKENTLLPEQSAMWIQRKIKPLWASILLRNQISAALKKQIEGYLHSLMESFYIGLEQTLIDKIDILSDELKQKWVELAYKQIDGSTNGLVKDYVELLDHTHLDMPHKRQTIKNFIYFKGLIELVPDIENKINDRLEVLKNGALS